MQYVCSICGKKSGFEGVVWYSMNMPKATLCKSHYMKWNRHHSKYVQSHEHIKPRTAAWDKMCHEESKLFMKWFKEQQKVLRCI